MKKLFTLLSLVMLSIAVFAQDIEVKGVVEDEKGEPVIGASIQVTGTTIGTISDYDGTFSLSVPASAKTLTVSFIGMQSQTVPVKKNVRVTMRENSEELQEVVVTGYGNVVKGAFAGSAQAVDADNIEKKSPSEISKALAGEVAGVQVVTTSGQPGTNASIRIRGIGSINASTAPLYVVDGVTYNGDISSIDPSDIATTTILKDATATSMYGSRGANGVILITTKKGTSGEEGKIDVDLKYGANMRLLPMYSVITSPQEYVEMAYMGIYNSYSGSYTSATAAYAAAAKDLFSNVGIPEMYNLWGVPGSQLINADGKFFDGTQILPQYKNMQTWKSAIFRVGQKAEATVKIHGGSEKLTYYTSFGYLKDEGYYISSDFNRFTVRSNIDYQPKKWLRGELNLAYAYSTMNSPGQGSNMNNGFAYVNGIPPIYPVYLYNADGTIKTDPRTGGLAYDYGMHEGGGRGFGSGINPAGSLRYDKQKTQQHQFAGSAMFEIKFYKDLKFTANIGFQYIGASYSELTNSYYGDAAGLGRIEKAQDNVMALTANQLLEYNKVIDEHTIRAMAGHETYLSINSETAGQKNKIADPAGLEWGNAVQMGYMTSATSQYALDSYLATVSYTYDDKYLITANYRADGSSKFAKGHRWGHFGSVGAAWSFTKEQFMEPAKEWLKNGKLRLSWGMLGNQGGISGNLYEDQYSIEYVDGQIGYVWGYKGNPDLTWERTSTVDLGLEFDISKYLTAELDYFYKLTDNMLFPRYTPPSIGYSYTYINGGKLENQGFEMQFTVHAVDKRNVKFDIRLNGAHYSNKVKALPVGIDDDGQEMLYNGGLVVGHSLYDYNMPHYEGVDPQTGKALYTGYYDAGLGGFGGSSAEAMLERGQTGNNYISNVYLYKKEHPGADIRTTTTDDGARAGSDFIGKSAEPGLDGGFGFNLEVYGVTLDVACSYRLGGYGYDGQYQTLMGSEKAGSHNWHVDMRNAWTEKNTDTNVPRLSNGVDLYANMGSDRFLISNTFLSLNNVRIGYNFPKKLIEKIKLKTLNIWVAGDNLAVFSARKGYNPLTSFAGSSDEYQYTPLSTIMGGIKFTF